ncbi:ribosome biogenesis GTPase Der [Candidatus Finniella inopinata]|uniref:GTPase Der n=1 Tax=Candidatus Finniella inopinata TaxID=1696036 RepID=A0A4Q7DK02_9PROT|nr:ribosome biogenesis GTPase Der [Candidatus Finniella inopinata]RZI46505.1 ribosome biogenesis GTPase Der [Candidatus Finniella inopinata]
MPGSDGSVQGPLATVAIVGRPNVGKSTLFNRFVGKKLALVHDKPGMTRDRRDTVVDFMGLHFRITDTPGLSDADTPELSVELDLGMRQQSLAALKEASVILFVIDGRQGCTPYDYELADLLRRQNKPVFVVINKCEGKGGYQGFADAVSLGLGEPVAISAEHGMGLSDLCDLLIPHVHKTVEPEWKDTKPLKPLQVAIWGRPNVGKSTLVNSFLGEERQLTADFPGVTRDSIHLSWQYKDRTITLVDTAGIRKKSRIDQSVEKLAVMDAERVVRFAEIVVLVIDGSIPREELIEKQDLTLAAQVIEEGRGLIFAINKWDQVKEPKKVLEHLRYQLDRHFAQARGIACVPISALKGRNLEPLMDEVLKLEKMWNQRLSTALLNKWLTSATQTHAPPAISGRRIRLKYMTQVKSRPPTFVVFCTKSDDVPDSYQRYLVNTLRKEFDMPGVPIRLTFRSSANPYAS